MKALLIKLYSIISHALHSSRLMKIAVAYQHKNFPIPIGIYNRIFSYNIANILLAWYGHHVFYSQYDARKSDEEYWGSDASLYYYAASQNQHRMPELEKVRRIVDYENLIDEDSVVVDFGCGTLKDMRRLVKEGRIRSRHIHGIDRNEILNKYFDIIGGLPSGIAFKTGLMQSEVDKLDHIDFMFVFGGTLQYLKRNEVINLFASTAAKGCKAFIVIGEGTDADDNVRQGGEWNYNFDKIGQEAGLTDGWGFHHSIGNNGLFEYWVACRREHDRTVTAVS